MDANRLVVKCHEACGRARSAVVRFVRNERGDAIQNVMIAAIAAVLLLALLTFGKKGLESLKSFWDEAK